MLKKIVKSMIAVGFACTLVVPVLAEDQFYGGLGFVFLDYSEEGVDEDLSLTAIYGRIGSQFNENFSGEIRAGFGVGDDSVDILGIDVDLELDTFFGAYLRGGIPVSETFSPYAVVGFTRGELTASASGFGSESESETDVSFGLGADITANDDVVLNLEYMNYLDKDGVEIDGFAFSVVTTF